MDIPARLASASAQHVQGDLAGAEAGYAAILEQCPGNPDALFLSGTLHAQCARWEKAVERLRQLLALHPNHAEGWRNLARIMEQTGRAAEALPCYEAYLRCNPGDAPAWFDFALAAFQARQLDVAERAYRRFLEQVPDSIEAHFNLGATLHDLMKLDEAKQQYRHVLAQGASQVEAHRGLGNIALHEREYAEAITQFQAGLGFAPHDVELLSNLGVMLQKVGRLAEAEQVLRDAIRHAPEHVNAHFNLGLVLLLQGKFNEGWHEYAWRHRIKNRVTATFPQPLWDGSPLDGKTILLQAEQGFGDTFQFVRYCRLLKSLGARVMVECQAGLKRVLLRTPGIDTLAERPASGPPLVAFDVHLPMLDLPGRLGTTAQSIPCDIPYIGAEPWLVERWAARLAPDTGYRVGIVWAGRPTHEDDKNRSATLANFLALADVANVTLYSIQKGSVVSELAARPVPVIDLEPEIDDFADTAAVIANLDLVISVDTSVAHLAGAMGKPVWVVLPYAPDWRWLSAGEGSPWYPSMRLFRQTHSGEWEGVFERVRAALAGTCSIEKRAAPPATDYTAETIESIRQIRIALRRADWPAANALCEALLARNVPLAEVAWLAGFTQFSLGRMHDALTYLAAAYEVWPQHPPLLKTLGMTLQALDQRAEAEQCYTGALQYGNDDPEVLFNLAVLKHHDEQLPVAESLYRTALAMKPDFPDCLNNLGLVCRALGDIEGAQEQFREAIRLKPDFFDSILNLGNVLFLGGCTHDAIEQFRRALAVRETHAGAHNSLGVALKTLARVDEAIVEFRRALALDPGLTEARGNLGNALKDSGCLEEAVESYRDALSARPDNAYVWSNLGNALQQLGQIDEAQAALQRALEIAPAFAEAHWNRALLWLAMGDYRRGWPEYEWGFQAGTRPEMKTYPRWDGQPIAGTLLVSTEQGFGDAIQFIRFLHPIRRRVGRLRLECQPALLSLFAGMHLADEVVPIGAPDSLRYPITAHMPLMSLAGLLGVALRDLPGVYPYLTPDEGAVARMRPYLTQGRHKVGIVWAGSSHHQSDHLRSCDPRWFAGLFSNPDIAAYSLQKPAPSTMPEGFRELGAVLHDFADTAGAIAQLDLVITVDTAVAHLAGAMGKPVWVLLPHAPDWRWGHDSAQTPWYPSARLFRQTARGDWSTVMAALKQALEAFFA